MMDLPTFYRGFLYALRECLPEDVARFHADEDRYHLAFHSTMEYAFLAWPEIPVKHILDNFDPVFAFSPEASAMLTIGERDFIIYLLAPSFTVAQFKIGLQTAKEELDRLPKNHAFRHIAKYFYEKLNSQQNVVAPTIKSISTIETLFDDESNRKKFTVMNKIDVMVDDSRNNDMETFWLKLDDFLKWGKKYKITIEEMD